MRNARVARTRGANFLRSGALSIALATLVFGCAPTIGSIGARLVQNQETGRVTVRDAPRDMTGAKAGLEPGDEILEIDGRDVRNDAPDEISEALRGEVGTRVKLTVLRGTEVKRLVVVRGKFRRSGDAPPSTSSPPPSGS